MILRSSLLGGFVEIQGKFWHSPSSCANCCADDAKVALQSAFSFCAWGSCRGMRGCANCCADDAKVAFSFCAWGSCWGTSSYVNCCTDNAKVAMQCAFSFCAWGSCWGTLIIHGFGTTGIVGMVSICGGSSTWDPLLFAASVGVFGGFLFMSKREGRSGGFFGGQMLLSSNPSSQADFFLTISLGHLERKVRNSARLLSGMLSFVMWLTALEQSS